MIMVQRETEQQIKVIRGGRKWKIREKCNSMQRKVR